MPSNTGQGREQETRCLCGIRKPVQRSATPDRALVIGDEVSGSSPLVGSSEIFGRIRPSERQCSKATRPTLRSGGTASAYLTAVFVKIDPAGWRELAGRMPRPPNRFALTEN